MGHDKNAFIEDLLDQIFDVTKKAYGEVAYGRWKNPVHIGPLENPDGYANLAGACGDSMQIFLKFDGGRVREASVESGGCGSSAVCGSFAAEMAIGKTPDEFSQITGEAIMERMVYLPEEDKHLAFLAADTLQAALKDYEMKGKR
jgi:nitrogen fixation NifU-like protein